MFGGSSSPPKEKIDSFSSGPGPANLSLNTEHSLPGREKRNSPPGGSPGSATTDERSPSVEKKRRSSSVTKAASFFSSARNSLHLNSRDSQKESQTPQTPLQKLGKMDPALVVPQGSLNNSAGESLPTSQSSFRVGVTEDKNRKCRRTMEDTHAYLYHFLGTNVASPLKTEPSSNSKQSDESIAPSTESNDSSHIVETDNGYFAIFDGHAGTFAAEWCGKKMHLILEDIMRKYPNTPVPELLDQTFTSVDQQLEKLPLKNSGCTAVAAVLRWEDRVSNSNPGTANNNAVPLSASASAKPGAEAETQDTPTQSSLELPRSSSVPSIPKPQEISRQRVLYTANVGDARIVLCRNGKALRLSYDHKGSDEHEGKRITNAGGLILNNRVNGVLAVTRALGDSYMKDLVTGHPYTTETVIQPDVDEFIILACDGLWDVCSDQEAVDLVRGTQDPQAASKILVDHALSRFSTDNLSCMIVRLDSKAIQNAMDRNSPEQRTSHANATSETNKIIESAAKGVNEAGGTISSKYDQTEADKIKDDILASTPDEEPGPEVSVPDETKDLAEVAGLNIRGKPDIKDGKEEEDKNR